MNRRSRAWRIQKKNDSNRKQCLPCTPTAMLTSVLPFTVGLETPSPAPSSREKKTKKSANNPPSAGKPEEAAAVTDYCTNHSDDISDNMKELWDWTVQNFASADKMSSPLQGATFKFIADWVQPKRGVTCFFFFLFTLFFLFPFQLTQRHRK